MFKNILFIILSILLISGCGNNDKTEQSTNNIGRLTQNTDEAAGYAKQLYGQNTQLLLNGDVNANKLPDALALDIRQIKGEREFWINNGGIVEKGEKGWGVILNMTDRLRTPKGDLINQVPAQNGYIVSFELDQSPIIFTIALAGPDGSKTSDDLTVKWDSGKNVYVTDDEEVIPQ